MKQCPRCNRNYADEALSFCLEDGEVLVKKYDPDATMINPFPPMPVVPPTVAYERTPNTQTQTPVYIPPAAESAQHRKSPWVVGALVLISLAAGLTIGWVIFQRSNSPASTSSSSTPAQDPVTSHTTTPTPAPASTSSTPLPAESTTASSNNSQSTTAQEPTCVLYNDKSDKTVINVREDCDTKNCEADASTIAGEYPDNTPVHVFKGNDVRGVRFTWVKVEIVGSGRIVWVASTKVKCG